MSRYLVLGSLLALSALAACEGAEARPAPTTTTAQNASVGAANPDHDLCVAVMTHSRTCTDQYLPALVDKRAELDHPAGIKAEVAKDRDGVIAQAHQEWSNDSTDANIEKMCQQPMPNADAMRADVTACQAKTDCGEFSACIVPIMAQSFHD
jgi:hypothetical protein